MSHGTRRESRVTDNLSCHIAPPCHTGVQTGVQTAVETAVQTGIQTAVQTAVQTIIPVK